MIDMQNLRCMSEHLLRTARSGDHAETKMELLLTSDFFCMMHQSKENRRNAAHHRTLFLHQKLQHTLMLQIIKQHHRSTGHQCRQHASDAAQRVEQRSCHTQPVICRHLHKVHMFECIQHHLSMRQRNAFRGTARSGRMDDRGGLVHVQLLRPIFQQLVGALFSCLQDLIQLPCTAFRSSPTGHDDMPKLRQQYCLQPAGSLRLQFRTDFIQHLHMIPVFHPLLYDHYAAFSILQKPSQHIRFFMDIHIDEHSTSLRDGELRDDMLPAVIDDHRHMIALPEPQMNQPLRQIITDCIEFLIREASIMQIIYHREMVRIPGGLKMNQLSQRPIRNGASIWIIVFLIFDQLRFVHHKTCLFFTSYYL